ncbi:zinc-ribbon domain-containing protein [Natronococcus amylolyticus]|nr:zinc-ribbon domain-containing protein [Natronococcus amylolyticus]
MPYAPLHEADEDLECPNCRREIPERSMVCPYCEISLH